MPTYGYRCESCEHEFETFQSIKASALRKCPECGKMKLKRQIGTGGAVLFKGGGFWQTDYRSESYKKGAEKDKKASEPKKPSDSGGKKDAKANAKPAPKDPPKPAKGGGDG